MTDPKRLADEQVREIERQNDDWSLGVGHFKNNVEALLADREALLSEALTLRNAAVAQSERIDALADEIEHLRKDVIEREAENAKLRRVVEAAQKALHRKRDLRIKHEAYDLEQALTALGAHHNNVPDATDDKG